MAWQHDRRGNTRGSDEQQNHEPHSSLRHRVHYTLTKIGFGRLARPDAPRQAAGLRPHHHGFIVLNLEARMNQLEAVN